MNAHKSLTGSCLCGAVRFEALRVKGPLELCHCPKCRKVSGGPFMPGIRLDTRDFRLIAGEACIRYYQCPLEHEPPAYGVHFCAHCGAPVPNPHPPGEEIEIAAGLFDELPGYSPDRHIYIEHQASWYLRKDALPGLNAGDIRALRAEDQAQ
ncbi:MAG: GFA family protein [Pseudomonadales bacterium]|jgi:hypothetical protein|nr:GFA family protein [Pseudomonadales bacterium]MDP6469518.1 GFA family protein [Pseudomonadales bacterium]MDP6827359.1 GFA family protein [Pseudomonadales bacterium]MDP6971182.1 GFA family protein [Pseudomonadales bacterium]|tara:strand:+ start:1805 stop:2260 length:456 start_codon:yes stop_codon:yes gene_type:complete